MRHNKGLSINFHYLSFFTVHPNSSAWNFRPIKMCLRIKPTTLCSAREHHSNRNVAAAQFTFDWIKVNNYSFYLLAITPMGFCKETKACSECSERWNDSAARYLRLLYRTAKCWENARSHNSYNSQSFNEGDTVHCRQLGKLFFRFRWCNLVEHSHDVHMCLKWCAIL